MLHSKTIVIMLVCLLVGFAGGFVVRPVIAPIQLMTPRASTAPPASERSEARGVQFFAANLEKAHRVVAGCRDGSVRGAECSNAERAIIEADSRDRLKRFTDR
jgi:hypothetical protein